MGIQGSAIGSVGRGTTGRLFLVRKPTLNGGIAWVAAKHIGHCQRLDRPNRFRPLLEEDWWRSSWQCRLSEFTIKVKEQDDGGTYVCLMGGRPWTSENGTCARVHNQIHWTIAKCASMTRSERQDLVRKLNHVLESWPRLRPLERPLRLLSLPSIRWSDPNRHGYLMNERQSTLDFRGIPQEQLIQWFRDDILGLPLMHEREGMTIEDKAAKMQHLINRDQRRHFDAEQRAETMLNALTSGILRMEMPSSALGGRGHSPELLDLLEYLAGVVEYGHPPCYGHPRLRLTLPERWHASVPGSMVELLQNQEQRSVQ